MTYAGDRPLLANVKATDAAYPLYGQLETLPANLKPVPGSVLVAPRLLALLDIKVGDNLDVGDTTLRIAGEVVQEPDSGFNPFQTAPGIIINLADVDQTGAVQPGSRLTYRYMFAGAPTDIQRYEERLKPQLKPDQRWYGLEESGSALGKSLQRSQQFLLLSALLTLLLSIAAVAVAMSHYCRSRYDLIAVLKTLGAGRKALSKLIIGQWLAVLLLAGICGSVIGLGFEAVLIRLLAPVLPGNSRRRGLAVAVGDGGSGHDFAAGWVAPVPATAGDSAAARTAPGCGSQRLAAALLPASHCGDCNRATDGVNGGEYATVGHSGRYGGAGLAARGIGWGSLLLLRRITLKNLALRLAVNRLLHQPWVTISQLAAFSLSFMLLALLLVLRGDLLESLATAVTARQPELFPAEYDHGTGSAGESLLATASTA